VAGEQDPAGEEGANPLITEALTHFPGLGPVRLARLHAQGIRSWMDVLQATDQLPRALRNKASDESQQCLDALVKRDIQFFVDRFAPCDKWRIVDHFLDDISFFDIETMGLEYDAPITVIVCWHQGRLHTFVEHENLDEFLVLLDEVSLLASFNGNAFDVPRVAQTFHIPKLPCPHVDFRWICYHRGFRGSLKEITQRMAIDRPPDLRHADGALAVDLWNRWIQYQDGTARERLLRYCAADVLMLYALGHRLTGRDCQEPWAHLPSASTRVARPGPYELVWNAKGAPMVGGVNGQRTKGVVRCEKIL
jgi:uncharacterized protein YprB with RNaseH-like and TPR domain